MHKLSWDRFPVDDQGDGYFHEPLTLREDVDSGAATHLARRRERDHVVAYLRYHGYDTAADDIEEGRHYDHRPAAADLEDQEDPVRPD